MARLALLTILLLAVLSANGKEYCHQGKNCHLPNCFCPTFKHYLGPEIIPQIVYFGFDDAVTGSVSKYYDQLFTEERVNPNGCPITFSLYVSHDNTEWGLVTGYYKKGNEIADHSVTHHRITKPKQLKEEAENEKLYIHYYGQVPEDEVKGWRSPDLATAGDAEPDILKKLGFTYDISLPYINILDKERKAAFPYTLDFGDPYMCTIPNCPKHKHPGFWEVPVNSVYDGDMPCEYIDGCRPKTEDDAYNFLMSNFNRTYKSEKAPFGLNMHAAWFWTEKYFKAMDRFIETILKHNDVYIISVSKMIEWMKTPKTIYESKTFEAWGCKKPSLEARRQHEKPTVQEEADSMKWPTQDWVDKFHKVSSSSKKSPIKSPFFRAIMN